MTISATTAARAASAFAIIGFAMVMLILKRRYEFWYSIIALHKLGAVSYTHLYRTSPKGEHVSLLGYACMRWPLKPAPDLSLIHI